MSSEFNNLMFVQIDRNKVICLYKKYNMTILIAIFKSNKYDPEKTSKMVLGILFIADVNIIYRMYKYVLNNEYGLKLLKIFIQL